MQLALTATLIGAALGYLGWQAWGLLRRPRGEGPACGKGCSSGCGQPPSA